MRTLSIVLLTVIATFSLGASGPPPAAVVASLTLNPPTGDAPFATSTVQGGSWCSIPEGGYPKISGDGVSGSVTLAPAGATSQIIGAFSVRGDPGRSVVITVENRCRQTGAIETASAVFRFNGSSPSPTSTPIPFAPASNPTSAPQMSQSQSSGPTGAASGAAQDTPPSEAMTIVPPSTGDAALMSPQN